MIRALRVTPFVLAVALSLVVLFTPGGEVPTAPAGVDKLIHALVFLVLAITGRYAGLKERPLGIALVGYALASEALQAWLPIERDFSLLDVVADIAGALVGLWLATARLNARRRTGRRSPRATRRDR